jgi:hypothetical protein
MGGWRVDLQIEGFKGLAIVLQGLQMRGVVGVGHGDSVVVASLVDHLQPHAM